MEPSVFPVKIYFEDTDCTGVVYHSNYLKYYERAREHVLGQHILVDIYNTTGKVFVVTRIENTFKEGARHGDNLEVRTIPVIESDWRLSFKQSVWRIADNSNSHDDKLLVSGKVEMVCINKLMEMTKLPDVIIAEFQKRFSRTPSPPSSVPRRKRLVPRKKISAQPTLLPSPFVYEQLVYFEDTDHSKIVYHPNYLKFCERARSHLFGVDKIANSQKDHGVFFLIYKCEMIFKKGAQLGDKLQIFTTPYRQSDFRLVFHHEIRIKKTPQDVDRKKMELLVTIKIELVTVDAKTEKLVRIPEAFMETVERKCQT